MDIQRACSLSRAVYIDYVMIPIGYRPINLVYRTLAYCGRRPPALLQRATDSASLKNKSMTGALELLVRET